MNCNIGKSSSDVCNNGMYVDTRTFHCCVHHWKTGRTTSLFVSKLFRCPIRKPPKSIFAITKWGCTTTRPEARSTASTSTTRSEATIFGWRCGAYSDSLFCFFGAVYKYTYILTYLLAWLLVVFQQLAFSSSRNLQACLVPTGKVPMDFPSFPGKTVRRFAWMWQSSTR